MSGPRAPRTALGSTEGRLLDLAEVAERSHLALFYFPGDGLGKIYPEFAGCTAEACAFRDLMGEFRAAGTTVLGASLQEPERQRAFVRRENLPFALVSDVGGKVAEQLGVPVLSTPAGERVASRTTLLFRRGGELVERFDVTDPTGHVSELLATVRELED